MQPKTLSIGGVTYDLFVRLPHDAVHAEERSAALQLPLGTKLRVDSVIETCGGGAGNTAVGLARLGCDASISAVIGSDQWGEHLLQNFHRQGVGTQSLTFVEKETTSFSIILSSGSGERVILYTPGPNVHLHDALFDRHAMEATDWIVLNHIQENACVIYDDLIAWLKQSGKGLTWNPGGCALKKGMADGEIATLLGCTRLLILNREELRQFTGLPDERSALKHLTSLGTSFVCMTDGGKGVLATDGKHLYHCPPCPGITVKDTTGAGDAFTTGATWGLMTGRDLPTALLAGTLNSGSVVGAIGAQDGLLTDIELRERLTRTKIDVSMENF
ncbi:carbohydrate kinase family protein [Candidatus Peribacteria bacterium]|nr:carbohydrate kinase family protein [Candidatus Peribacteria bacterium]